jgi:hypothetical protein
MLTDPVYEGKSMAGLIGMVRSGEDGLIVEHWAVRDDLRAMLQAGIVTSPGPPR